jgi:tetratricopeptide (TPR) repeat protein
MATEHLDTMSEHGAARAVMGKAAIAFWQADYLNALPLMYQSFEALEKVGEEEGVALALLGLGMSAPFLGDVDEGRARLERSREIYERLGNEWGAVVSRNGLGWLLLMADRFKDELPLYEEAHERATRFGTQVDLGMALANLGRYWIYQGDNRGIPYLTDALVLYSSLGNRAPTANIVEVLAEAAFGDGDHRRAARLFEMATAFRNSVGALPMAGARERIEAIVVRLREEMGAAAYERAVEEVSSLPFKRAIEEALQVGLAHTG